ncbi:MAG: YtxH domain-containing protein, partial [Thermoanaerobaculia bacterium]
GKAKTPYTAFSLFFLVGSVIGATVALFFAPTTGRKLQKQFKSVLDDGVENVQSMVKRVVNA